MFERVEKKKKKKKSTPVGVFGRPRIDRGVPSLLPVALGSRQVACLWGVKWVPAIARVLVGLGLLHVF